MPPLGREHDEVEGVHRLDLEPAGATASGRVARVERLHDYALVPARKRVGEELRCPVGVGRHDARDQQPGREQSLEQRHAFGSRAVEELLSVEVQGVEHEQGQRCLGPDLVDVDARPDPARGLLERTRPPSFAQRDRLTVEDNAAHRQAQHDVDELRHPAGDVVESAGEDAYGLAVVAPAVDLHAYAVDLPLERGLTELVERGCHRLRCLREHRLHRSADLEPELGQSLGARGQRRRSHRAELSTQHHSAPDVVRGQTGGLSNGVGDQRGECTLAQLTSDERARNRCSSAVARASSIGQQLAAPRLRACARESGDRRKGRVDLGRHVNDGSAAGGGTSRSDAQPTPVRRCSSSPER